MNLCLGLSGFVCFYLVEKKYFIFSKKFYIIKIYKPQQQPNNKHNAQQIRR
jgi:hypothetical protein